VTHPPGTAIRFATPALTRALDVVGSPRLTVQLDAPAVAAMQAGGPAGRLVLYAKIYGIGPDSRSPSSCRRSCTASSPATGSPPSSPAATSPTADPPCRSRSP